MYPSYIESERNLTFFFLSFVAFPDSYADPEEIDIGNYSNATGTVYFVVRHHIPENQHNIRIEVFRYEDDPNLPIGGPHKLRSVLNRLLFLANTTETGYACTVLEMPDTTNFTEVMCRFARNEATRNVSKFVVNVTFSDVGDTASPLITLSAQINFIKRDQTIEEGKVIVETEMDRA